MPTDVQIAGASCPMIISKREFKATPLTDKDNTELDEYVQFCMLDMARRYSRNLYPNERKEFIQAAISSSAGLKWISLEGSRIISTPEGGARLGWQMIQARHKMSFEDFKEICLGDKDQAQDNMDEIDRVYTKLNIPESAENNNTDKKEDEVADKSKNDAA